MRNVIIAVAILAALFALGCGGDDDSSTGGDSATTGTVCSKIFECFETNWGFTSEQECQDLFLTDCTNESAYLSCAAGCVAGSCDALDPCEPNCWDQNCK